MSAFLPERPGGWGEEHPWAPLVERRLTREERRSRWAVHAARWRAVELAESVFGDVARSVIVSIRLEGPARGLLELDVPFRDLETHQELEARFLAAATADPVLSQIPLVYVFGAAP